jgi:hypothetical protein
MLTFFALRKYGARKNTLEVSGRNYGTFYLAPNSMISLLCYSNVGTEWNHKSLPKQNIRVAVRIRSLANTDLKRSPSKQSNFPKFPPVLSGTGGLLNSLFIYIKLAKR